MVINFSGPMKSYIVKENQICSEVSENLRYRQKKTHFTLYNRIIVVFSCLVSGSPPPSVSWSVDNVQINPAGTVSHRETVLSQEAFPMDK